MRLFKCILCVISCALLSCFVVYPFLHELGHALALALLNCRIVRFSLFPLPFVECDGSLTQLQTALVALSGNVFPLLFLFAPRKSLFLTTLASMTGVVGAVFCAVSVAAAFLPIPCDDINRVAGGLLPAGVALNLFCVAFAVFRVLSLKFYNLLTFYLFEASEI